MRHSPTLTLAPRAERPLPRASPAKKEAPPGEATLLNFRFDNRERLPHSSSERVLTALIGRANVAGPTLNSLGGDFGLPPLLGKALAVISDARFAGRNGPVVVERLLSISGEDAPTVNRKYRDQWTGRLHCRLHIISNELPHLGDASQAVIGRIVLLPLSQSWLGKEDHDLEPALHAELTGVLNWALDGVARLTGNKGRFTRIAAVDEAIAAMRDLASPVAAFVRERCCVAAVKTIKVDDLYAAYRSWAEESGHSKPTKQNFGRDLRAAIPSVRVERPRGEQDRPRQYVGIDLAAATELHACVQCGQADGREEMCAFSDETIWLHRECQQAYRYANKLV